MEVEKTEALVYIYSNSRIFCQKPGANSVRYYDDNIFLEDSNDDGRAFLDTNDNNNNDNIFLEDSNDDGGAFLNTNDDNNNDNGGKGYNGNDGDAFDGREEHSKEYPPINPRNVHQKNPYDWNEINNKVVNGVDRHVAVGSSGNMYVSEDVPEGFGEHGYDQTNEESNDDDYNDIIDDYGEENRNKRGRNSESNNRREGGASGTMVSGNNEVAYIGYGDGGPGNAS